MTENSRWDDAVFEPVPETPVDPEEFGSPEDEQK